MGWVVNATTWPLYSRERPGTQCIGGWMGPRIRSRRVRKISPLPGFDPWTVQSVASRYTDWAIPALKPQITRLGGPPELVLFVVKCLLPVGNRKLTLKSFSLSLLIKRSNLMQQYAFIHCTVTLHVSGVTAPIVRSTKNCICYLWYRSWYWYS
jgi:hypothetical protein